MRDDKETEFTGNVPGSHPIDATGNRIFGTFGVALLLAAILAIGLIALIWWLAAR